MKPTIFRQAFSERWTSMRRKLPIIIAAAFACYGLYYLDVVKRRFDEEKSTPVLINKNTKARLEVIVVNAAGSNQAAQAAWKDIENFILVDQYTAEGDFINKIAARISADAQANEFVAHEKFKKCVADALETPNQDPKLQTPKPAPVDASDCAKEYLGLIKDAHIRAENRIADVYRYIKPLNLRAEAKTAQLDAGLKVDPPRKKGYVESSLQPILNEQSGVYIIYQILRIGLIVVIAFALISVAVLLLTTVMLSDGIKVLTDHATSFIGLGKGSIAPAAKAGVLSVAALGLGGAFVAGASTSTSASEPAAYQRAGSTSKSPNATTSAQGGSKDPARPNVTHHDGSNITYTYGDAGSIYDQSQKTTVNGETPSHPFTVKVFPDENTPQLIPIERAVTLDPSVTASLNMYLESLKQLNQDLSTKIAQVATPQTRDDIKVSNLLKDPAAKEKDPLLILDASKGPISTSIDRVESGLNPIKDLATNLDNLQVTNVDRPAEPQERSFIGRLIRGPDKYFVSKRSLDQLENLGEGRRAQYTAEIAKIDLEAAANPSAGILGKPRIEELNWKIEADRLILAAVREQYLNAYKPADSQKLYGRIKARLGDLLLKSTMTKERQNDTIERLQYWRDAILIYTRID
jgi:hypothetical protein